MKDKRIPAAGKRRISLTALALAACMILGLSGQSVREARAVNLDKGNCSLTVHPVKGMEQDAAEVDVAVDLYKVADAVPVEGYDTYTFHVLDSYKNLESLENFEENIKVTQENKNLANETYQALAQETAKAVFAAPNPVPEKSGKAGEQISGLDSGLYLLIARGADLSPEAYITSVGEGEEEKFATIAHSREYTYTFEPQLVALPGKEAAEGTVATSNPGEWIYNAQAELKWEWALRYGNLEIVKNLPDYAAGETASFVFQIEAVKDGVNVYSDVATLTFDGSGSRTLLLEGVIPVGASVNVTEVYSGASYRLDSEQNRTQTVPEIPAPDRGTASVEFTNIYQGTNVNSGAITNHFEYHTGGGEDESAENTGWKWTQQ